MCTYLQVIHPVLTFGFPVRVRRTGDVSASLTSELDDGDFSTRGALINGRISHLPSGIVTMEDKG